jgi:TolB-like protein
MGEQQVKNIEQPIRIFRLSVQPAALSAKLTDTGPRARLAAQLRGKPSLAIKPFENLSGESDQDQFADALSNGIIVALTRMPHFVLVGDESPSLHRSKEMTAQELGEVFDVRYVLKGNLRKLGSRIRVVAELMEVSTGQFLWAENFDRDLSDLSELFAVQDEITEKIVVAMEVKLLHGDAARLVRGAFQNPIALQSYYNGENLMWNAKSNLELREAQHLIASATAHATAALIHWVEVLSGWSSSPVQSLARATELAREAIRLNDVTGYPHLVLAQVHLSRREFDEANAEADLAVSTRPSCPAAYSLKASVLIHLGRPSEAIEHAQFALRLTPVHPPMYSAILASAFYGSHRYEEAADAASAAIELDDSGPDPYLFLSAANMALDRVEEAQRAASKVLKLKPEFSLKKFAQAQPYKNPKDLDCLIDHLRSAGLK